MAEGWAPGELYGLWVVADYRPPYGWVRAPYARLTCPHGCHFEESGDPADVARFVASIRFTHALNCPGEQPSEDLMRTYKDVPTLIAELTAQGFTVEAGRCKVTSPRGEIAIIPGPTSRTQAPALLKARAALRHIGADV